MMECRWYYGYNDLTASSRPAYRKRFSLPCAVTPRELFETDSISNNPLGSIVQKVSIYPYDEWATLAPSVQETSFFCQYFYSTKTTYLHQLYGILADCLFP